MRHIDWILYQPQFHVFISIIAIACLWIIYKLHRLMKIAVKLLVVLVSIALYHSKKRQKEAA